VNSRPFPGSRQGLLLTWFFGIAVVLTSALVFVRKNPTGFLHPCLLRTMTGIPCPACGTTRMARLLSTGQVGASFVSNPLAFLLTIAIGLSAFAALAALPFAERLRPPRLPRRRVLLLLAAALIAANWAFLIVHTVHRP
jgi:hypothetical protein